MTDLEVAFKLNDQILTFWQFYAAWVTGIVGWVLSRDSAWSWQKRQAVGIGVLIFNVFNLSGLYKTSSALFEVVTAMRADDYPLPAGISGEVFGAVLQRLSTPDWYAHIVPHLLADVIVCYFLLVVAGKPTESGQDRA